MYKKTQHVHFVGVAGVGMSGIAEVLLNLGYKVSGSDLKENQSTERLRSLGGVIYKGHRREHVDGADVVVVSSAIGRDNPEVLEARARNIPVIPRAEMLAELMRMKYGVAVAGSHGKTTTTSLIATILAAGGKDPTIVIGGRLNSIGTNARLGRGDFLVAEADESDGSFLLLSPTIAVVTNIDAEHLDHYLDMDRLKEAFLQFINKVPFYGLAVLCMDHPGIHSLIPRVKKRYVTYGLSRQADFRAHEISVRGWRTHFKVVHQDRELGTVCLHMPGTHNVSNALAAIAVARELEVDFDVAARALERFEGIQRRFQVKGTAKGVLVVDDYGHHPAEIRATLDAARRGWEKRIVVVFQPHRYTRTKLCFDEFLGAFNEADLLVVIPIYAAGEEEIEGVSSQGLVEALREHGHREVVFIGGLEEVVPYLLTRLVEGDMVITLGAGNVYRVGEMLLEALRGV
jgi:UDP-N-acetylmuramate--alanine ligase